ncbi:hypothetical protein D3C85_452230 [compost metagenome]
MAPVKHCCAGKLIVGTSSLVIVMVVKSIQALASLTYTSTAHVIPSPTTTPLVRVVISIVVLLLNTVGAIARASTKAY